MIEIIENPNGSNGAKFLGDEFARSEALGSIVLRCEFVVNDRLGSPCWEWTMAVTEGGSKGGHYSRISMFGRDWKGHRLSYLIAYGELIPGLEIDHKCENTTCVNPAHLQQITGEQNNQLNHARRKK